MIFGEVSNKVVNFRLSDTEYLFILDLSVLLIIVTMVIIFLLKQDKKRRN